MCGLHHADGRLIVTMDDDLQNPPSEIHKLIEAIAEQRADLVYGQYVSKKHVVFRNIGSAMVNGFYRLVFPSKVTVTSFRIMRRELAKSILGYTLNYTFIDGLLAWNTDRIGGVDYSLDNFFGGYATLNLANESPATPYVIFGVTRVEVEAKSFLGTTTEDESDFSYGAGVNVELAPEVSGNVEYMRYYDKDGSTVDGLGLGVTFNF